MPNVARKTSDSAGGVILTGSPDVLVNGLAIARHDDTVKSHGISPHGAATLISTARSVYANGIRIAANNNTATCGHTITPGSNNVLVGVS